jgi:hypothetical protein
VSASNFTLNLLNVASSFGQQRMERTKSFLSGFPEFRDGVTYVEDVKHL